MGFKQKFKTKKWTDLRSFKKDKRGVAAPIPNHKPKKKKVKVINI